MSLFSSSVCSIRIIVLPCSRFPREALHCTLWNGCSAKGLSPDIEASAGLRRLIANHTGDKNTVRHRRPASPAFGEAPIVCLAQHGVGKGPPPLANQAAMACGDPFERATHPESARCSGPPLADPAHLAL